MPGMTNRLTAMLATALLIPAAGGPSITKYRIDQSLSQDVDASAAGGARQRIAFKTSSFVTVTLSDSGGGKVMRVVIDSLLGDSAVPIPKAVLDSAKGAVFHGFLQKSGRPSGLEPTGASSAATQVQGLLSDFFPWIKSGLKLGDSWSDTTAKTNAAGSDSVTVRRVSDYKVSGAETWKARKAVRITENFTSSVAGTQPTPNGPARIQGTGKGRASYYVAPDGRYLGGDWQQESSLSISGSFAPHPLPIVIVQKTTITAIK
jgi:hypothetical protein